MLRRFVARSIELTKKALSPDMIYPPSERELFRFASESDLRRWVVYSDSQYGGQTEASLSLNVDGRNTTGVFAGHLSTEISEGKGGSLARATRLKRSGFTGVRTADGEGVMDLEPFNTIAMRIHGDGRWYICSLRTDSWVNTPGTGQYNTWQAYIIAPKDRWAVVKVPLDRYMLTWRGKFLKTGMEMNPARVVGMGWSLAANGGPGEGVSGPGPFRLELDWVQGLRE
ncbi:hypothetical protein CBR_g33997 [Chara braunii]|uniref:NADH:ubiquinone oxidoreductase intermediate-associated protein 30 domain-containing protein n=1 Tax=Chara braunii TaxID=69332 RepID=A0A388LHL9_CHABU|nr:hypothetical protein CBR_g33997 [Chara braunii]|eukprot:GBG81816.1 hypothetical protein CBR_g33997 [Chara braunii]